MHSLAMLEYSFFVSQESLMRAAGCPESRMRKSW